MKHPSSKRWLAVAAIAVALTACAPTIDQRGWIPDDEAIERIRLGGSNRADVAQLLGSPTSIGPFGDDTWYYISRKTRQWSFLSQTVMDQSVVVVEFDTVGYVANLRRYDLADGKAIVPSDRRTPTPGRELSLLEQLIGNVGRFNKDSQRRPTN
jgi:outer membrane protein assembly factor BamE (lipoprotein component of BamABCDE complex)